MNKGSRRRERRSLALGSRPFRVGWPIIYDDECVLHNTTRAVRTRQMVCRRREVNVTVKHLDSSFNDKETNTGSSNSHTAFITRLLHVRVFNHVREDFTRAIKCYRLNTNTYSAVSSLSVYLFIYFQALGGNTSAVTTFA